MRQVFSRLVSAAVVIFVMALGIAVAQAVLTPVILYAQSLGWAATEGEILRAGVDRIEADGSVTYHAWADYRYRVDGETYTGTRLYFGQNWNGPVRARAQRVADRYPAGTVMPVFYDPADPGRAVVERRVALGPLVGLPLGLVFAALAVGIPAFAIGRRAWRRVQGVGFRAKI